MSRLILVPILFVSLFVAGCQYQRPTPSVRESADFHFQQRDYVAAADDYAEIVSRYPGDWDAQYHLGMCQLELNQISEARRALEIAYTHRPLNDDVASALAEAMHRQGDTARLFAFLRERAENTKTPKAYMTLGQFAAESGDPDAAKVAYDTAIALDNGKSVVPYLAAAAFHEELGDLDSALMRLRQAYGINPHDLRVKTKLAQLGEVPGPTLALPLNTN